MKSLDERLQIARALTASAAGTAVSYGCDRYLGIESQAASKALIIGFVIMFGIAVADLRT